MVAENNYITISMFSFSLYKHVNYNIFHIHFPKIMTKYENIYNDLYIIKIG